MVRVGGDGSAVANGIHRLSPCSVVMFPTSTPHDSSSEAARNLGSYASTPATGREGCLGRNGLSAWYPRYTGLNDRLAERLTVGSLRHRMEIEAAHLYNNLYYTVVQLFLLMVVLPPGSQEPSRKPTQRLAAWA